MRVPSLCRPPAPDAHPWGSSNEPIREQILPLVYDELRRRARVFLARERSNHTLEPTALVHEAYLRLAGQRRVDWTNRAQLIGMAAEHVAGKLIEHENER